jgi:hypothetical protein
MCVIKQIGAQMTEKIYKDFLNREIAVGDYVAFQAPYNWGLKLGRITKFTPQNLRVAWSWKSPHGNIVHENSVRRVRECVRVDGPDLTMYLLTGEY